MARGALGELVWYFQQAERDAGHKAQSYDGYGGGGDAGGAAHDRMHRESTERYPGRARRVESCLNALEWHERITLQRALTPYGAKRAAFGAQNAFYRGGANLIEVALRSECAVTEWRRERASVVMPSYMTLREWVEALTQSSRRHPRVERIAAAAEREYSEAVARFEGAWEALRQLAKMAKHGAIDAKDADYARWGKL